MQPASFFQQAKPVWMAGREWERNRLFGFVGSFQCEGEIGGLLQMAGATSYRVYLDGVFLHHGPARAAHGWHRVDEVPVCCEPGHHWLAIEVLHHAVPSYDWVKCAGFLQVELILDDRVVLATGGDGFQCRMLPERVQKVDRYSMQRPFAEVYRLEEGYDRWRTSGWNEPTEAAVQVEAKQLIARGVDIPEFRVIEARQETLGGRFRKEADRSERTCWWMKSPLCEKLESFPAAELEIEILPYWNAVDFDLPEPVAADEVAAGQSAIRDFGRNLTGFIGLEVRCEESVRLVVQFDELLLGEQWLPRAHGSMNLLVWDLAPGHYHLESSAVYTLRYLKLLVEGGALRIDRVWMREYANDSVADGLATRIGDPELREVFQAGVETFRQNAPDLYMDCPSRERAGWLCDGFFTGRVEPCLCDGATKVERNFLENFILPPSFPLIDEGMLPMCYPADHVNSNYIPQWAMWYVLELREYVGRSGDRDLMVRSRSRVEALLSCLTSYENGDGLLEKLPRWNFIEWSHANKLTKDVNYPTNMLYAGMLEAAAELLDAPALLQKAAGLKETVRTQSWADGWFRDHAVRDPETGELKVQSTRTEVCQYYAFFFGIADRERDRALWEILLTDFGPDRPETHPKEPEVHAANAFIGFYLRMALMEEAGEWARLLKELKGLFLQMARRTGTLWENKHERGSLNHGFASYVCHVLLNAPPELISGDRDRG